MSQSEEKNVALNRYSLRTLVTSAAPLKKRLMSIKVDGLMLFYS